ncbi:alpha/beta fold hydrolase [Paenibacillus eucommiae]|uniref:Dienelactone hydrolase n=1 Tax=Paenibacillus eucommiae TaxID=1355755 RepID=A0ABS4IR46_9BACL|nr:alpha/beta fold hydrolase [Paenibacillus eucommiae]MBP1990048.1 dienelactone hydrolase [Paenibacillus eucommiae]
MKKTFKLLAATSLLAVTLAQPLQAAEKESTANTLVPLRQAVESIGASVEWDSKLMQAKVTRGSVQLIVTIGDQTASVNHTQVKMNEKAILENEKTIIPLTTIQEAFHVKIAWNDKEGIAIDSEDTPTLGSHFVHLLQTGQFEDAFAMMNKNLQQIMNPAFLQQYWQGNTAVYGIPDKLMMLEQESNPVHNNVSLGYATAQSLPFGIIVRFDSEGKIDDLFMPLTPAGNYQKPSYDNPDQYTEKEIVIGHGAKALPATLTLPKGEGPFPAVVLVHGSGPNDRDETIGSYKTFRDLAVGLAAQNIAVVRYEKQTREHTLQSGLNPSFTVKEETIDDSLAAVKALQGEQLIDAKRIFVLGHSQGGMLIPRIVDQDSEQTIAGSIIMAAPATPFEDVLLTQYKDILERTKQAGQPTEGIEQQIAMWEQQMKLLKDPQYSVTNIPKDFMMSNPVWWFDFSNYYGGEVAKKQEVPLLILQGDNDFQSKGENLQGWKDALNERKDVAYKLYPKLNHGFVEYDKPSTGEEYALPGNVPSYVIDDISEWLKKQQ